MNTAKQEKSQAKSGEWQKICQEFKNHFGVDAYEKWFETCRFEKIDSGTAFIKVTTRSKKQTLSKDYMSHILSYWKTINPNVTSIMLVIGSSDRQGPAQKYCQESHQTEPETEQQDPLQDFEQLPIWPEATRGTPNAVLRGALFGAIDPRNRKALQGVQIAKDMDIEISFTGWQLCQSDKDVWELIMHLASKKALSNVVTFKVRDFLNQLYRDTGKSQRDWLKKSLWRLTATCVDIKKGDNAYSGSLIVEMGRNDKTSEYSVAINPNLVKLYNAGWTQYDYEDRVRIGNKKFLALWLHGYIASHAQLYPTKIETYHRLSGSDSSCSRDFKRRLLDSLKYLQSLDLIKSFAVDGTNLVHIDKHPSPSQQKYLNKNK